MTKWISVTAVIILYVITCEAQFTDQTATCADVQQKLQSLSTALQAWCNYTSTVTWTSVQQTLIGTSDLRSAGTTPYNIPSVIPSTAREVFILVGTFQGDASEVGHSDFLKMYTQQGTNSYEQYLYLYSYLQEAVSTNSDNMWFPMPSNRLIYLEVPLDHGPHCWAELYAIGYR